MVWFRILSSAALVVGALVSGRGAGAVPPLDVYGRLPGFERAAISPSGDRIALIGTVENERRLIVTDRTKRPLLMINVGDHKLRGLYWAGEERVMFELSATVGLGAAYTTSKTELTNMVVVPVDGKPIWPIFDKVDKITGGIRGFFGTVEREGRSYGYFGGMALDGMGDNRLLNNTKPNLYEVDLATGKTSLAARRAEGEDVERDWLIGPDGSVAASLDFLSDSGAWTIRDTNRKVIASGKARTGAVSLISLGRTPGTILYFIRDENDDGRLFELPLAGGEASEILADEAVSGYLHDRRSRLLTGFVRESDTPEERFFDKRLANRMAATRKAFPGLTVELVDANDMFDRLIVQTNGPEDPQSWWLVDLKTGAADVLGVAYSIAPADVGPMRMVRYKAADGLDMGGVLTLPAGRAPKNLPVVILPHGGPYARDYPVFDWWAQALASRGYAVFQPNFRGSSGLGEDFRRAGNGEWGRKMQSDMSDGLAALAREGIVDPRRACIVGASYGGYAALAGVTLQQGRYRCAVSVAGISDVQRMYTTDVYESGNDATLIRALKQEIGSGRDLKLVSPITFADRADAPVLLIHGLDDTVVPFVQSRIMASALQRAGKPVELVTLKGEDHWLSRGETRLAMLKASVAFVEKHNPPDPAAR